MMRGIGGLSALGAMGIALMLATAAHAQQTGRMAGLQLEGDQPIEIESDRLEVRDNEGTAIFTGNVQVVQGETTLRAGRMVVHYVNDGSGGSTPSSGSSDIERLEVEGTVHIATATQVATGDRGTFDMRTDQLTLTGSEVVLTEGDNVIVGCALTVQMSSGVAELDGCGDQGGGRVRMLLQPGSRGQ
ncbi:LPS ABC transporter substrate-binding protein LptA [Aliihoeflea aestuarii]|jgi:lipopolysaccharide export system protein LptA|uniref:LptA/OstA family protein n=1 Tax=Aliihoeflea aestuarii TaxID=453840 RepID=UPI0020922742|nr:LptA/OstA family protein [Aliihoeflea aestuarii]MCO6391621.1 LPS ABC transporter substrate-binding protein LptA [Aliihoeflea aestuarii]